MIFVPILSLPEVRPRKEKHVMKMPLRKVRYSKHFTMPDAGETVFRLVMTESLRTVRGRKKLLVCPVGSDAGGQRWVDWETEVEVLGE
jgi:hypothetical protein